MATFKLVSEEEVVGKKPTQNELYAVIDLGSNSFHMLIATPVAGALQTIGRVKRKVRLAAGLDDNNDLSLEAMERGWECLALFAERLQDIPSQHVRIVATATLRLAKNAEQFRTKAEQILGHPISVISGETEAKTIFMGVAHTSSCTGKQLVIDIGGASTEIVIGQGDEPIHYNSLDMGCVTFLDAYFKNGMLSDENYDHAIAAASEIIKPIVSQYKETGWAYVAGASGTVQAIQEIMVAQRREETLTLDKLYDIRQMTTQFNHLDELQLPGLSEERRLVFVSGLAILIAIFESLEIEAMGLAGGALREGILYSMIPQLQHKDIRRRTITSLVERYHIDRKQSERVAATSLILFEQLKESWQFGDVERGLLLSAAKLHEVGLLIEYKQYPRHGAYILANTDMPGFTRQQHLLVAALVKYHKGDMSLNDFINLGANEQLAKRLVRLVRIAVILSMRRQDDVLPRIKMTACNEDLHLDIDTAWLNAHPLMRSELIQEVTQQRHAELKLTISK